MKIVVAVVVYNRINNIKRWLHCWKLCDTENAELIIIHNYYGDNILSDKFKNLCDKNNIKYVSSRLPGFDIARFQDVCRERLVGFPNDWTHLLWCCDDTLPMRKDFISRFIKAIESNDVGISAMQISKTTLQPHVRTTGFCIRKEVAEKITFPVDPVVSKQDCYLFEHRSQSTLTLQIRSLGLSCVQVAPLKDSPLFDTGYHLKLDRQAEHYNVFPSTDKVTFICTITKGGYPQIISSLLTQTNPNWELLLIHNGESNGLRELLPSDKRVKFIEVEDTGYWGHPNRSKYLQEITTEYVCITNNDNYIVPVYVEYMMRGFTADAVGVYCSEMVHSYKAWEVIKCSLNRGFVDCAGVMLRTEEAQAVGWNNTTDHSADWIFFNDLIKRYGKDKFIKINGCLLVHN